MRLLACSFFHGSVMSRWLLITAWDRGDGSSQDSGQSLSEGYPQVIPRNDPNALRKKTKKQKKPEKTRRNKIFFIRLKMRSHACCLYQTFLYAYSRVRLPACLISFPDTLEFFAVAFTTAVCFSNKTWQVTCACYTPTWTKTNKTSNPYLLHWTVHGVC